VLQRHFGVRDKAWILPFGFHLADAVLFLEVCVRLTSNPVFLSLLSLAGRSRGGRRRGEGGCRAALPRPESGGGWARRAPGAGKWWDSAH